MRWESDYAKVVRSVPVGVVSIGDTFSGWGAILNPPNHVLVFNKNSATIEGWDFSLEGGWTVVLQADNLTLQNNNFKVGENLRPPIFIDANALNLKSHQKQYHRWQRGQHQSRRWPDLGQQ